MKKPILQRQKSRNSPLSLRKKKVSFCVKAKDWDGLRWFNQDLDSVIYRFLVEFHHMQPEQQKTELQKLRDMTRKRLGCLYLLLLELLKRLEKCESGTLVPCLPNGGGKCLRVSKSHFPALCVLFDLIQSTLTKSNACTQKPEELHVVQGEVFECLKKPQLITQ